MLSIDKHIKKKTWLLYIFNFIDRNKSYTVCCNAKILWIVIKVYWQNIVANKVRRLKIKYKNCSFVNGVWCGVKCSFSTIKYCIVKELNQQTQMCICVFGSFFATCSKYFGPPSGLLLHSWESPTPTPSISGCSLISVSLCFACQESTTFQITL